MPDPDGLTAALMQLSQQKADLARLDARETADVTEIKDRVAELMTLVRGVKGTVADQAEILAALEGLDGQVAELLARLDEIAPGEDGDPRLYQPVPAPRWWKLQGEAREEPIARLRAWVERVYRPGYGAVAAALPDCWERHDYCLYLLDWLSELWSVLYLQGRRTPGMLSGQAEWQTRLLSAAAEQMAAEARRCGHSTSRNGTSLRMTRP